MRYNFLTDSYEEDFSPFVTDFSKYEVIDGKEIVNPIRKYTSFQDEEEIKFEEIKKVEEKEDEEFEIEPKIKEEELSGFILESFEPIEQENKETIIEKNWLLELEKINEDERLEKISAQLLRVEIQLSRMCDYLEKIFKL